MSSPAGVRHRAPKEKKRPTTPTPEIASEKVSEIVAKTKKDFRPQNGSEWDYKLAITIITALAFITRFWGISHPDQVVFDEVHFGKVGKSARHRDFMKHLKSGDNCGNHHYIAANPTDLHQARKALLHLSEAVW